MKKDHTITVMVTKETKKRLLEIAQEDDRTLSYIVNKILEDYVSKSYKK